MSEPVVAVMLVLMLVAAGEAASILSRARVPMLLVVMLGYLVLIWTGVFPKTILDTATLGTFGAVMVAPLIIHMGTIIPFKVLKGQVKAIVIALSGMVLATVLLLVLVPPMFGYPAAVASAGPITGGIIAFIITSTKLKEMGMVNIISIPALILAVQGLVGMPLAAHFLRKYANKLKSSIDPVALEQVAASAEVASAAPSASKTWIPEKFQTHSILLLQLFIGGGLAIFIGKITGVSYSVWALVIGIVGAYFKFYQPKMMEKANSFGIAMVGLVFFVASSMNDVTPSMFAHSVLKVVIIMLIGIVGIIAGGYVAAKLLKWDINKGIAVALTALFGFPGDYFLCDEVSRSIEGTEKEKELIFNELMTPMLVGGFTTVTTASIVVASILMKTL
ncbi:hypothetical protein [Falsibacillus pallidus]|uniref:Kef-type K+ transport system membrane component KefB n=1 Tax=Falsibacillus pallidus TaxID=493781 RepID=A0A370GIY7_9BACI|nr:hypothetical protein [Falsibacillus pallidus]RDI41893.1 Kef-type K+ transport system membrane component KefB [Falsibacillus pallidus]